MVSGRRTVLVFEDDRLTLRLLAEVLNQSAFVVSAASTAAQARLAYPETLVGALVAVLARSRAGTPRHDLDPACPMARLSRTQVDVLRMVALGMSDEQVAHERGTTARAARDILVRAMVVIGATDTGEGSALFAAARHSIRAAGLPAPP